MKTIKHTLMAATACAMMGAAAPASAASFILNGINSIGNQAAREGFLTAANYWANTLTDNVTVSINVNFTSLGTNPNGTVLGQTSSTFYFATTNGMIGQILGDQTSALDAVAAASIAPIIGTGLAYNKPGYVSGTNGIDTTTQIYDNDGSLNNQYIRGTGANLKALGFTGLTNPVDGSITFNSDVAFDFNPTDGISAGTLDFLGVAIHEFGHALGFTSRVDAYDVLGCPKGPSCAAVSGLDLNNTYSDTIITTLDLFRYSQPGLRNLTPGQEAYFSIDGGVSELYGNSNMSTGVYNGDGRQASHWKAPAVACNEPAYIGTMNPYLCSGQMSDVTAQDLGAFDAIGWNLALGARDNATYSQSTAQIFAAFGVPEPATWLQLILGFGVIGGAYRSARRRKVTFAAA